ncbi:MAG: hypothetical protein E7320_00965 [Clostridiales bacterium]|nr:hypothetical protein [Clostridiales bacterium]
MLQNPFLIRMPVSILLLAAAAILTIYRFRNHHRSPIRLSVITALCILSVTVIRIPIYRDFGETVLDSTVHSVVIGIQTVGLGGDLDKAIETGIELIDGQFLGNLQTASASGQIYASYCIAQHALCPLLCAFAVIKTISSALGRFWLHWFHRGPVFFFSDMTQESLLLAESIQKTLDENHVKAYICFATTDGQADAEMEEKVEGASFKKLLQYREALSCKFFPMNASHINCILCHPSEQHNLNRLMQLLEKSGSVTGARKDRALHYFIFANSRHAEKVVDQLSEQYITLAENTQNRIICMLNTKENLAVHILDKHPLWSYVARDDAGHGKLNVLIAGNTRLATHFLRNCIPCGQVENCSFSVTVADVEAEASRQKLYRTMPMLAEDSELVRRIGSLHFETLSDPMAVANDALLKDVHYVLLAYEDDKLNIQLARQIKLQIERQKLVDPERAKQKVAIVYNVLDPLLHDVCVRSLPSGEDTGIVHCSMLPVGNLKQQYSTEVLFGHELLRKAFYINCTYSNAFDLLGPKPDLERMRSSFTSFMNSSYDRRASLAAALQIDYRNHVLKNAACKTEAEDLLTDVEHYRWAAYAMLDGFSKPTDKQLEGYFFKGTNTHRSLDLFLHPCLVTSEQSAPGSAWDPTAKKDELDLLSLKLHDMAANKLRSLYADNRPLMQELKSTLASGTNTLADKIGSLLPDAQNSEKKTARRLASMLFIDFKKSDRDIVQMTDAILKASENTEAANVLSLFWLNT